MKRWASASIAMQDEFAATSALANESPRRLTSLSGANKLAFVFVLSAFSVISSGSRGEEKAGPSAFVGEWISVSDEGPHSCAVGDFEKHEYDGLIRVTPRQVLYWESMCDLRFLKSEFGVASIAATCRGEGETWKSTEVWSRRKLYGRDVLIMAATSNGRRSISVYERCKAK